ncbi:MAG: ATP-binding protein, partial [Oscillochloris sp.]|nr:ATP-binding protein [Oscillochloris sp.]
MKANPYVGPRSFITGEKLYGRDRELRRLANLLIAERIVLLYSPSGAGKTSLVQAALVPRLGEEGFQVLPPIRVGAELPSECVGVNRYILSAMLSIEGRRPAKDQIPLAELAGLSLDAYLERIADPALDGCVLIFDQFEEILSLVPNDRTAKEAFFVQVGVALRSRARWALFSMREDYIAQLDPFLREIPTRLANRMRLDLLDADAALTAVQKPAHAVGVTFVKEAAQQLIDDLRMVRIQLADGSTQQEMGLYVEPVQLQVVCYRLWSGLPEHDVEISVEDVAQIGDVTTALRSYYADRVASVAQAAGVNERLVRDWFDTQLITAQGLRGQVLRERGSSGGLLNSAINALIDSHLVRGEPLRGAIWYELTHDR